MNRQQPLDPTAAARPGGTEEGGGPRRPYTPPRLEVLGDLRTLTLGGSPGVGDSGGGAFVTQPPI